MKTFTKAEKKKLKKIMVRITEDEKKREPGYMPENDKIIIERYNGEFDWEYSQFLVEASSVEEAKEVLKYHIPEGPIECPNSIYDCTGRPFSNGPEFFKVKENRYFVTCKINYDL
jgi:hypothetical protein